LIKKLFLLSGILFASCVVLPLSTVSALEGGGSHYFGGGEDFFSGSWPPPGLAFNFSTFYFNYEKLKGNDGQTVNVPGGFAVDGVSNSVRIQYTTQINILGGNLGWYVAPALVYQYVSSGGRSESETTLADINFGALISYHWKTFHQLAGIDAYAPTGTYDKNDVCNIGLNYWSFAPIYAFTYLGDMDSPLPGFEVSAKFMYFFHTTNTATDYTSGQEFSFDYLIGQHFGKSCQMGIGIAGHYEYQVTDDTYGNAPSTFDGYKSRQFTIGPALQYWVGKGFFTLKALFGVYDINHGEGSSVQLKYWCPF